MSQPCGDGAQPILPPVTEPSAPNTAPPGVLDHNAGRSIYSLLASAWFYGDWKAGTATERAMQAIMEREGWWPIRGEGALMTMIGRELMPRPATATGPAWKRIDALFARHGLPAPPVRLRDELVAHLMASEGVPL